MELLAFGFIIYQFFIGALSGFIVFLLDAKTAKQQQRRIRPKLMEAIEAEVKKIIDSGFTWEEQYAGWVTNIVPVLKKNGKIRIYRLLRFECCIC